jgi:maleate isomerase
MLQNDNWGDRARIGMFIVASEAVPEAEWWAMLPANVSVHAARVSASSPWAPWQESGTGVDLADDLARGARQFATMRLSVVVIGHSSSSFVGCKGWDEAVVEKLTRALDTNAVVTTNGLDTLAALRASGVRRPFLIIPPWINDETMAAGVRYYKDHGFEPSAHLRYDPGPKWRDLPPGDLYRHGMGFAQEVAPLQAQIQAACPAEADGVLIAGTGFRCVAILDALEQDLKRPVLSANQASLWHCLKLAGVQSDISGYGNLFKL